MVFGVAMLAVALLGSEPLSLHGVLALTVAAICVALLAGVRPRSLVSGPTQRMTPTADDTVYLRHSDPDAAGRQRPRAPDLG
ncbi:DUF6412 domain-containing protein [Allorhizocola rhizosphaerae]|uniref:DUF6412 domain-containing protein n=1 Tax=Allorhizocola rhizosphaerae TaxID=1872709 RepID=UPI000E3BA349|nr:DUF6412 domain-containing protein [Allorhizocola rhizosphaerae]